MPRTHRPSKVDANQPAIVAALRAAGWQVCHLHAVGGVLDLLVSKDKFTCLLEVKMPGEKLTPAEKKFCETWAGEWAIVHSEQEAVNRATELLRGWERMPF
jgi:hypothetical protein